MQNIFENILRILESQKEKLKKLLLATQKIIPELQDERLEPVESLINEKKQILSDGENEICTLKDYIGKWDEVKKGMTPSEVEKIQASATELSNLLAQVIALESEAIDKISKLRDKRAEELKKLMSSSNITSKYTKSRLDGKQPPRFIDDER